MGRRASQSVLRLGDWVQFDDGDHQMVALSGTSVRLRSATGSETAVLLPHLLGSPGFAVVDGEPLPELEPFGLLDGLPSDVLAAAKEWERHVVEVVTGLPAGDATDDELTTRYQLDKIYRMPLDEPQ